MRTFKLLPHTADVRLKVRGDSLEELFCGALDGMNDLLKRDVCKKLGSPNVNLPIDLSSADITSLLIDFLSGTLSQSLADHVIFCKAGSLRLDNNHLTATLAGLRVNRFDRDIKAVSYHGAQITSGPDKIYNVTVVFDV